MRNPFRASFDRATGDLYIADNGENAREEINYQSAASLGGENYGWRLREGSIATPTPIGSPVGGPRPAANVDPLYDYGHGVALDEGNSATGGYVYRGPIGALHGAYFFGDFVNERIWSLRPSGNTFSEFTDWTSQFDPSDSDINGIVPFGEDGAGNLYIVDFLDGEIFSVTGPAADADFDQDLDVDGADFLTWQRGFGVGATLSQGDANSSGMVDAADLAVWESQFGTRQGGIGQAGESASVPAPSTLGMVFFSLVVCSMFSVRRAERIDLNKKRLFHRAAVAKAAAR